MNNSNKKWTENDYEFLKKNYSEYGINFCAKNLFRSKRAILEKVQILKLKVNKELKRNIKHTKEKVVEAVEKSFCYADVIRALGLIPKAGNFDNIKNRIIEYGIDISHFLSQSEITKIRLQNSNRKYFQQKPLIEILIKSDVRLDNRKIKNRLYKEGLKTEECELCGQGPIWNGKRMSLRLDHINGENTDYRIENLRIVCPNCDATLETYCSGNRKNKSNTKITFSIEPIQCIQCKVFFKPSNAKHKHCSQKCRRLFNYKPKQRKRKSSTSKSKSIN